MHTFESKIKPDKISGSSYVVLMPSLGETILGQQDMFKFNSGVSNAIL